MGHRRRNRGPIIGTPPATDASPVHVPESTVAYDFASSEADDGFVVANVITPLPESFGRYRRVSFIGRGGFGEVWRAFDPDLDCFVAVKTPRTDREFPPAVIERFLDEGRKLARLRDCVGIVTVYDTGVEAGYAYIVSEVLDGGNLDTLIHHHPPSRTDAVRLTVEIADALHGAHLKGLIHRDIKPGNILLSKGGRPKIADFGLAVTETEQLSEAHGTVGTLAYMSPEQAAGNSRHTTAQSDIYSLGVLLYRMLTGRFPFLANDIKEYREQVLNHPPRPLRTIDDTIPAELERICLKCLAKDPQQRYATAADLAGELRGALDVPADRPKPLNRGLLTLAGLCVVAFGVLLALLFRQPPVDPHALEPLGKTRDNVRDGKQPATPVKDPTVFTDWTDKELKPFRQYRLLKRPPKTIEGPLGAGDGKHHNAEFETLLISSRQFGMFSLGTVRRANYRLRMEIVRNGIWEGKAGFFIGYSNRTKIRGGTSRKTGQFFLIMKNTARTAPRNSLMMLRYDINTENRPESPSLQVPKSAPLPEIREGRANELELTVRGGRLAGIRWNGRELSDLRANVLNDLYTPDDYRGDFGIVTMHTGGVIFKNPTITVEGD